LTATTGNGPRPGAVMAVTTSAKPQRILSFCGGGGGEGRRGEGG